MSANYMGEVNLQFLRHGRGAYRYPISVFRYTGGWKTGTKSGRGIFEVAGGSTYEGSFVDGELQGRGSKQWTDGRRYEGEFNRGEASGEGSFTSPAGESYVGTWTLNKRHGRGNLVLPNGEGSYVGEFQRHRYHGNGRLLLASGFQYSGTFFSGLPHGIGDAVYPGGSVFHGPFENGRKHGRGGKYVCGLTGICWGGEWIAGVARKLPSKWEIELDSLKQNFRDGVGQATPAKPGGKLGKGGGAKKGGKVSKSFVEEPEMDDADKPVIVHFNDDGAVAGLWCRCVRDVQPMDKPQSPPVSPELQEGVEEPVRRAKEHQRDIVSEESGRTLAVTLHEVMESPPSSIGAPVPFFVRRPDATDVSESLGRFPEAGLLALFQRDGRCYPKGTTTSSSGKLLVVPGAQSALDAPVEQGELSPPAKASKAPAIKSKGGGKGEAEPIPSEDDGVEARWRAIRSEVQSNRCLVIRAGENISLATPPLFVSGLGEAEAGGGGEKRQSALDCEGDARVLGGGEGLPEQKNTKQEGVPGVVRDTAKAPELLRQIHKSEDEESKHAMMIQRSSPFALCLDFRLDMAGAPEGDSLSTEESRGGMGGEDRRSEDDKVVRIVSCSRNAEVSAVVRLWKPPAARSAAPAPASAASTEGVETERSAEGFGSEAAGTLVNGEPGARASGGAFDHPIATTPLSPCSGGGVGDDPTSPRTPTWYLHAVSVRCGTYVGTVLCVNPEESALRRQEPNAVASASSASGGREPSRSGSSLECDLAEWHALALVVSPENGLLFCIDGDEPTLQQVADGTVTAGTICGESGPSGGGRVVMGGGAGGEWVSLALKNLAVYKEVLCSEQLRATTRVFRAWREGMEAARATDAQEDERWGEEAKRAAEEEREPDERPEWLAGADQETELVAKTIRGEAKIDKIVLPKAAVEGGAWVLRVTDVSHQRDTNRDASTGRARLLAAAEPFVSEAVISATAMDDERNAFPPLPGETVKLERA